MHDQVPTRESTLSDKEEIRDLLIEIRDNQRSSLEQQKEHLEIAKEQIERSRGQVQESIELQRQAMDKVKNVSRLAIPGILICIVLIVYLIVRYL
jgi:hypothetical protein